uniref:40S ribosomal protein S21-like n=1 Tax=Jaculus jaculus TaxID=51337 RepID=UPI001E1B3937|nr:40S ribosomal protein S21-like [Jaculus jaculus]
MQNDSCVSVDPHVLWKCLVSNRIIAAKDHASIQMNMARVGKVTGRFNHSLKPVPSVEPLGESDDSILRLAKANGIVSKNF